MIDPATPDLWILTTTVDGEINSHAADSEVDYWTQDLLDELSEPQLAGLAELLSGLLSKTLAEVSSRG